MKLIITTLLWIALSHVTVNAQDFIHQTEPVIPIGSSPGISNVCSVIGTVTRVDDRSIRVGTDTLTFTKTARFWQDRSKDKMPFITIDIDDIQVNDRIEAKHDECCEKFASCIQWAKVQR